MQQIKSHLTPKGKLRRGTDPDPLLGWFWANATQGTCVAAKPIDASSRRQIADQAAGRASWNDWAPAKPLLMWPARSVSPMEKRQSGTGSRCCFHADENRSKAVFKIRETEAPNANGR